MLHCHHAAVPSLGCVQSVVPQLCMTCRSCHTGTVQNGMAAGSRQRHRYRQTCSAEALTWARLPSRAAAAPALPSGLALGSQTMRLEGSRRVCRDTTTCSQTRLDTCTPSKVTWLQQLVAAVRVWMMTGRCAFPLPGLCMHAMSEASEMAGWVYTCTLAEHSGVLLKQ